MGVIDWAVVMEVDQFDSQHVPGMRLSMRTLDRADIEPEPNQYLVKD